MNNFHSRALIDMKNLISKLTLAAFAALVVVFYAQAQSGTGRSVSPALASSQPDAGNLRAFIDLARSDLKTQKALIIAENLPMTEGEGAEFWPLHREYDAEITKLNDQKFALIVRYAKNYKSMTDKEAGELAKGSFDLEDKKTDLKRKYFKKLSKVMPATKVARFFQIENQLNMVLDLQVAASLPLIK
jgi:hypothetical protein